MRFELIQNIIDILRHKTLYLPVITDKKDNFNLLKNIKTLILGSSHLQVGYLADEKEKEFNLATPSQDLYYSYQLYKKAVEKFDIKNIILSYSVFSQGLCLIKTCDANMCALFKILFDIKYQHKNDAFKKNLYFLEPFYKFEIERYKKEKAQNAHAALISGGGGTK